ncbi:MAG TPA: beta-ketoacyl-ACP synthase II [Thermoflexales bacterium]|nr:beta-ketoacyl-ACP synthase II [Thermoflexales bacterium]HQX09322.1 beta-ketoacyl-ACP synthase II [Thermoflexales bacterium]HQY23251.1 beta-ketoacyl-ACP synthase II [Thermoflexales bacterium]HQZ52292.1 beta-ketoacyl-ACP synthase II [Thermoflexales bacterium]HRA52842.1 beta-ketoacyl-ACP synthase II [Thermoflexales bacterium]
MENRRVVVTGIGAVTPLGNDIATTWDGIVNGRSGLGPITRFPEGVLPVKYAAEVKNFDPLKYFDAKEVRRTDIFEQYGVAAARQAVDDAGLVITPELAEDVGVVIGSSVGGFTSMLAQYDILRTQGYRKMNVFAIPMIMGNGAAGMVAIKLNAQGPSYSPVSACATSNDSVGQAFELVRRGAAKVMVAGGADATVASLGMAGFEQIGALSHDDRWPPRTPRPFDKTRDGTVVGEGACCLVLEEMEFAVARGARILAEIVGYGQTTDAFHVIAPAEGGKGAARAIKRAMAEAGVKPEDIGYINAHGTATPANDPAETAAIKSVMGDLAYKIPISSTKSMTGHMMGATGALEAAICIYTIRDGIIPPTINYTTPDPLCDLDYVPNEARKGRVNYAINNSFGFGGHNSVVVFKRFE